MKERMTQTIVLFDEPETRAQLLPLTFTRPVGDIRTGIYTQAQRWKRISGCEVYFETQEYLRNKFKPFEGSDVLSIDGAVVATQELWDRISKLQQGEALYSGDKCIALCGVTENVRVEYTGALLEIRRPWDIFSKAAEVLDIDYDLAVNGRRSGPLPESNTLIGPPENLFIEDGAIIEGAIINVSKGPVFIDRDAEIMEGSMIRGPFYLGEHSQLKMGAKIYGACVFGPHVKVGGEVNNSVIFGYSSKAHDGFLGNSVLGEWCNLGADTNNSNLKNNYAQVKLWSYVKEGFVNTGLQFCGLIMADHSKCGINTMFNTGTVVGVSANIFGAGFPRNFLPSFSWGGPQGMQEYQVKQAVQTAELVFARRGMVFDDTEKELFAEIFAQTARYRTGL